MIGTESHHVFSSNLQNENFIDNHFGGEEQLLNIE